MPTTRPTAPKQQQNRAGDRRECCPGRICHRFGAAPHSGSCRQILAARLAQSVERKALDLVVIIIIIIIIIIMLPIKP
jgi:hypothetical protein